MRIVEYYTKIYGYHAIIVITGIQHNYFVRILYRWYKYETKISLRLDQHRAADSMQKLHWLKQKKRRYTSIIQIPHRASIRILILDEPYRARISIRILYRYRIVPVYEYWHWTTLIVLVSKVIRTERYICGLWNIIQKYMGIMPLLSLPAYNIIIVRIICEVV